MNVNAAGKHLVSAMVGEKICGNLGYKCLLNISIKVGL
jgi:hypothetical protein